jgi:hypothetical protein
MRAIVSSLLVASLVVGLQASGRAASAGVAQRPGEHDCAEELRRLNKVIAEQKTVIDLLEKKIEALQRK